MTSVLWYRRDLRLHDLPALAGAIEEGPVAPLFVFDDRLLHGRWPSPNRAAFLIESLNALDSALQAHGNRLHIRHGDPAREVPAFAQECKAKHVFVSRDYSPYARARDRAVGSALGTAGIQFHPRRGTLVHEPEDVRTGEGQPFSVFSPFFRRWQTIERRPPLPSPADIPAVGNLATGAIPSLDSLQPGNVSPQILPAGEASAQERLRRWAESGVASYTDERDDLAAEGTSRLSQDLKWGLLSPVQILAAVDRATSDSAKFVSEVAWREFYYHVLWHNPRVLREPFQRQFASLEWDEPGERLEAWKQGHTGYPVIDAAMRQLLATGYMHNRARMIVASFLTKDLHLDWRLGEAHFMEHLVDGDVANNNGGWQWAASTGTDPQPYFRIFNPWLQSRRYDPDGAYIRRWVPELAEVPGRFIHEPSTMSPMEQTAASCVIGRDYPAPIVDHATERDVALRRYSEARSV